MQKYLIRALAILIILNTVPGTTTQYDNEYVPVQLIKDKGGPITSKFE